MQEQRKGRSIAMGPEEVDAFLAEERTCRVGTVDAEGTPHVSPLWFVWDGTALWLNSIVRSQRWVNLTRDARLSIVVDAGHDFMELRGVELIGRAEVVGQAPRSEAAGAGDPAAVAEQLFGDKYAGGTFFPDGRHAWLRVVPEKVVSWDFRKMAARGA